jgi:histidinol phosphatase-like PHP family hydrolase
MNFYRYETHAHTSEVSSCGKVSAEEMVGLYHKAGYRGIIFTDHLYDGFIQRIGGSWKNAVDHYLIGYRTAKQTGEKLGMDIMLGMELRFDGTDEDYLVYGFDEEYLYNNPYPNRNTLASFRASVQGKGMLIFQAHPYRKNLQVAPPELLDGVEGFNGNPRHNSRNDKAFAYCLANGLFLSSGSDAHQPQDVGRGGIGLTKRIRSGREFVELFLSEEPIDILFKL